MRRAQRRMPETTLLEECPRGTILECYWWWDVDEPVEAFSTWFLQYFFMSFFDMPELLAFCCAMQSFICSFLAARSLLLEPLVVFMLLLVLLLVLDGAVELG
jgi:hypothetical protein